MGAGTVVAALFLPRWRAAMSHETLVLRGAMVQSAAMCGVACATQVHFAAPIMFVAGMAWIATANALIVSVQLTLPDWVCARGMAMYQMAIMGASAARRRLVGPGRRARRPAHQSRLRGRLGRGGHAAGPPLPPLTARCPGFPHR